MKNNRHILLMLCFFSGPVIMAQQEYTLHFTRDAYQSLYTNPSFKNPYKRVFALPSLCYNYGNNAFTYQDLVKRESDSDSTFLDIDGVISQMSEKNVVQLQTYVELLGFYFVMDDWFFSFGLSNKYDLKVTYSKEMIDLLWNGNAKYIGQTIDIGPGVNVNVYKELALGAGREIGKWDVGMRIKLLNGITNVQSVRSNIALTTEVDNYATTLSTDYEIRESGLNDWNKGLFTPFSGFRNFGMAFDLGVGYKLRDKWNLAASVVDLGAIRWKNDVKSYKSNGSFTYSGIDIIEFIEDKEIQFDKYKDSLSSLYFREEYGGKYTGYLTPKSYISATYHPNEISSIGALVHMEYFHGVKPGICVYAGREFARFLQMGLSYSYKNWRFDNVGFNLTIGPKVCRFYFITDTFNKILRSTLGRNSTFRFGININLGEVSRRKTLLQEQPTQE